MERPRKVTTMRLSAVLERSERENTSTSLYERRPLLDTYICLAK